MKKAWMKILTLFLTLALGMPLAACGGKIDTGENCIDVCIYSAGYGTSWCEEILKDFVELDWVKEKYPGVKYTFLATDQVGFVKNKIVASNNNHYDLLFGFDSDAPSDYALIEDITESVYGAKVPDMDIEDDSRQIYAEKLFSTYQKANRYVDGANAEKYYTTSWAGGMNGIFYNEDILDDLGFDVPRTTDELIEICDKINENRTDGIAGDDVYEGYAFTQAKGLSYWTYMFPIWWAQYEGVTEYEHFYQGIDRNGVVRSYEIFDQTGRLYSLELFEEFLAYDKHLNPASLSDTYTFKYAQTQYLRGNGVFHVNGDWFENEMKDIKAMLKKEEGVDYSFKLMRTPVISALGTKLGITEAELAATVDYVDGVTDTIPTYSQIGSEDYNAQAEHIVSKVKEARGVVHSIGAGHMSFVPSYARDKDIAIDFLLYMATDEAQITYMDATGGATLPFSYDVKKENPEFYNQLSEMQKERLDYFYNENYDISVLLSPDSFPLVKFGGVREFTRRDYHTALSLNMSGWNSEDVVTAQKIYDDTKSYWTDNGAQRWTTAVNQAGI